jgi:hypothetical protein
VHGLESEPVGATHTSPATGGLGAQAAVDPVTRIGAETFPAASNASTANVYVVAQARPKIVKLVELVEPARTPFAYTS